MRAASAKTKSARAPREDSQQESIADDAIVERD